MTNQEQPYNSKIRTHNSALLEFAPLDLSARDSLTAYLRQHPPLASEYTFSNLFAWQPINQYAIARYGEGFLIRKSSHGELSLLQPLVPKNGLASIKDGLAFLAGQTAVPAIERVGEDIIAGLPDDPTVIITEDRDQFDYLYDAQELIDLPGERFHDKKNLLAQFRTKYNAKYLPLTPALAKECVTFAHQWCIERNCERAEGLARENCAVVRMLAHFAELHLLGGALTIDDQLIAFTLAEPLTSDTLVIHVEKADNHLTGAYQAINHEFLIHQTVAFRYVNREQDLGVKGLRKAKLSYNPVRLIKKYRITAVRITD